MASWYSFLRLTRVAYCWMWASSRSRRSLVTSVSRFLFSSIWAEVAPAASPRRSPMFSRPRAKSDLWRSALARACLSASGSSSSSSIWAWFSLMAFWLLAARLCSSSSLERRTPASSSLRSTTDSWITFGSPSTVLLYISTLARPRFSFSREDSSSSRVLTSLLLIWLR